MEMLKDLKKGQCIFSDFYGRVGKMVVHCPFEEMTEAFRTQEDSASSKAEEKFAMKIHFIEVYLLNECYK